MQPAINCFDPLQKKIMDPSKKTVVREKEEEENRSPHYFLLTRPKNKLFDPLKLEEK